MASTRFAFNVIKSKEFVIGDEIIFDSDPEDSDDDELHLHKGVIKVFTPKNQTIQVKSNENGDVSTYFIDEIRIKSISPSNEAKETESTLKSCMNYDFTIFEHVDDYHSCIMTEDSNDIIKNCKSLQRLISGLEYYSLLNISIDKLHQDIFANFVDNIYNELMDDFNHLDDIHKHQLQQIHQILIQNKVFSTCQMNKCIFTARHHNANTNTNANTYTLDASLRFYKETMDSVHFYLFHLFDCGLMTLKGMDMDINVNNGVDDDYYDKELSQIQNNMNTTKRNTLQFDRYNNKSQNKYSIIVNDKKNDCLSDATFIEGIQNYVHEISMNILDISNFTDLIQSQQYDTDAIVFDIDFVVKGNIMRCINNRHNFHAIQQFIKNIQLEATSFNIGFIFYYWPYFSGIEEMESFDEENVNDHRGHAIKDLYIERKYSNFKQEILSYEFINITDYKDIIVTKAQKYLTTHIVKRLKADLLNENVTHYGIAQDSKFSFSNIVSLILYTDFSDHSADFSSTFRKKTPFESLQSIKTRNKKYWWMSKILRETVEIFGQNREGIWDGINEPKYKPKNRINKLIGPFFTGLSYVMAVPQFNIRLCSPTSTSSRIEVAIKFGGAVGMVIQLNNPTGGYELGKGFNCSWISRYKEEDERLFFGGSWRTKIESIRILSSNQNFGVFFHCLTYFDGMVNGKVMDGETIRKKDRRIIQKLINWKLKTKLSADDDNKFDDYVYKTFDCFCRNKIQIVLPLETLQVHCNKQLRDIIMYPMEWNYQLYDGLTGMYKDDKTNLFRGDILFQLFPALTSIIIYSAAQTYTFSLMTLLSLIGLSRTLTQIKIKAERDEGAHGFEASWLCDVWSAKSTFLIQAFQNKGYIISLNTVKSVVRDEELEAVDVLWIRKMSH